MDIEQYNINATFMALIIENKIYLAVEPLKYT